VAGDYFGFVGEGENCVVEGAHDFLRVAAGEVGAPDGAGEENVAGDQFFFDGEVEADAAFGVAGSVEDLGGVPAGGDGVSGGDAAVDFYFSRGGHADPLGLYVQHFQEVIIVLVEQDGRAGGGAEFHGSADVVDVSVGDDDLFDLQIVLGDYGLDVGDVVAGVDDHSFAGEFVTDDGAVALQGSDGDDFVDHGFIVNSPEYRVASTERQ